MDISVILVSFNTEQLTKKALEALQKSRGNFKMEVIIIDNASEDNSVVMLKKSFPQYRLIENKTNVGFGRANNQALPFINSDFILLLNTDAFVKPDSIAKSLEFMASHPECGLMGAKLLGQDNSLQPSCRFFPTNLNLFAQKTGLNRLFKSIKMVDDMSWDHNENRECDWVPGCYYIVRKEAIDQVGLFDPLFFLYYEEVDHCKMIKDKGWKVMYYAGTEIVHIGGESASSINEISEVGRQINDLNIESEYLYFRKHYGLSGVVTRAFLSTLSDVVILLKRIIKLKKPIGFGVFFNGINKKWTILSRTKLGKKATR